MKKLLVLLISVLIIYPSLVFAISFDAGLNTITVAPRFKCMDTGIKIEGRESAIGQWAVCIFKDGSICEMYNFERGDCKIGQCKDIIQKYDCSAGERCDNEVFNYQKFRSYLGELANGNMIFTDDQVKSLIVPKLPVNEGYGWILNCCKILPNECVPMDNKNKVSYLDYFAFVTAEIVLVLISWYFLIKKGKKNTI